MRELILIGASWLHLVATVIWIGGIFFILFIAIPSAKKILGDDAGKLMGEISNRFTPLANYSIYLILITGIVLSLLHNNYIGVIVFGYNWTSVLLIKHILVVAMTIIHFYRGLILTPKIGRTTSTVEKGLLQKLSMDLVKANLALGMLILLFSGITSTF